MDSPKRIGVDEISFRKRHDYVTIVAAGGKVVQVAVLLAVWIDGQGPIEVLFPVVCSDVEELYGVTDGYRQCVGAV